MKAPRSHVCFLFMVFCLITAYPCILLPTNRQALILEAVAKHKNFITASQLIKASLKLQCNVLKKCQNNEYTANTAENSIRADKLLIIS